MREVLCKLPGDESDEATVRLYYETVDFPKVDLCEVHFEGRTPANTLLPLSIFNEATLDRFYRACEEDYAESLMAEADDRAFEVLTARAEARVDEAMQEGTHERASTSA